MLKQGLKNYVKNLKHFFTPMGAMFLGFVFGASVFLPILSGAFHQLIAGVNKLSQQFNVDFGHLFSSLFDSVSKLDWSKPMDAVHTMISNSWLKTTVGKSLEALLGVDYHEFAKQIGKLLDAFTGKIGAGIVWFALFFALGILGGYYLTAYLVRREIEKPVWWKFLLTYLVDFVVNAGLAALGLWLFMLWKYSAIFFVVVASALSGFVSLLNAYTTLGRKGTFKQIVSFKRFTVYLGTVTLVWFINFAVCVIVGFVFNGLVAAVVALALVQIVIPVNKLTAEQYVLSTADGLDDDKA